MTPVDPRTHRWTAGLRADDERRAPNVTDSSYSTIWFNALPMTAVELDRTFAALADPTRRAILRRLVEGDATLSELAEPFPVSIQAVAKHLKVLEEAGLVSRGKRARLRPVHLEAGALKDAADWIGVYRPLWERGFERIDHRLADAKERGA
jgi:DNA-binding transcriptional ArsR family regulator